MISKLKLVFKYLFKFLVLFIAGGCLYMGIELAARGFTHWTMGIVGGICFILIGFINECSEELPLVTQMVISSIIITILELVSGIILNIYLGLDIWDYSDLPYNLLGQICPLYSAIWFVISPLGIFLDDIIRWRYFNGRRPHYTIL